MATHTTIAVGDDWTILNTGDAATGLCSLYAIDNDVFIKVAATEVAPTSEAGMIPLPSARRGGGIVNQTLAAIFPGIAGEFIYAKAMGTGRGGRVTISCA